MPTFLDDIKLRSGAYSVVFRPQANTADKLVLMPLDKAGTLMLVEDLAAVTFFKGIVAQVNAVVKAEDGVTTNINLVLQPKGTGAIVGGAPPDSATTGGNARGTNAVDLQQVRTNAARVASGSSATISGGGENTASGVSSSIGGGDSNTASGSYSSILGGRDGAANKYGQSVQSSGKFSTQGDAQTSVLVARVATANATPTEMFLDGAAGTQRLKLVTNNLSWTYSISVNAHCTNDRSRQAAFFRRGKIYRLFTDASTALLAGELQENIVGALTWGVSITADTTNGALKIAVTGEAAVNLLWVARIELVEVFG